MKTKILLVLISILFVHQILIYGDSNKDGYNDSTAVKRTQLNIFSSFLIATNISDAHGTHGTIMGSPHDATVDGIVIKQNWGIGVNTKFYLFNNVNLQLDLLYSNAVFPEQEVTLDGSQIKQPKSNLSLYTISAGPGFRFSNDGIFRSLNPYAFISLSVLLGYASDVNSSPNYGIGGYSFVSGIGYNFNLGTQYHINNFIIAAEYRFEYMNSKVHYFRSFNEGLNFIKSTSYFLIGLGYAL